jgi:hypothetical protein
MYIGTIALGLWFSATSCNGLLADEYAEWPVNIWCWGLFAWYYRSGERKQRIEMLTVVAFATPMELFFSEVWLIYEYQRDLMPLFVPAGHYFLFDLGRICAGQNQRELGTSNASPSRSSRLLRSMDRRRYFCGTASRICSHVHPFGPSASIVCRNGMGGVGNGNRRDVSRKLDMGK